MNLYRVHHDRSKHLAVAVVLLAVVTMLAPAQGQECQTPLFVQQSLIGANVMILADNSFSMNEVILHDDYMKSIDWSGDFENDSLYYVAKAGNF